MRFDLVQAVAVLTRTPAVLDTWLRGLPDAWTQSNEGGESWSAYDIVGHLIHGERTDWLPRLRILLEHGEARAFEPFDRFAQQRESAGKSLAELLDEFASLRRENLDLLRDFHLSEADLDRRGMHPELGGVTARQLLATWTAHDLGHIRQIGRVMARQYADEVGAWRAYMPVMDEG